MKLKEFCIREKANVNSETKQYDYIDIRFCIDECFDFVEYDGAKTVSDILQNCDSETLESLIIDIDIVEDCGNKYLSIDVMPEFLVRFYEMKEVKV